METNPLLEGLAVQKTPEPFSIIIFGATGDLTRKKLIPALYSLFVKGYIPDFTVIGFARRKWTHEIFREKALEMIKGVRLSQDSGTLTDLFLSRLFYVSSAFEDTRGYEEIRTAYTGNRQLLYYLSAPPESYESIVDNLGRTGLAAMEKKKIRIIIEKPFGRDLESAGKLNRKIKNIFKEKQIYRIDHYLGKETVQNIMVLRFGNGIFEPLWNNNHIEHVQITMAESIGVGTRGNYYEQAGALRDIVQNHLLQLLCHITMEPPNDLSPDSIRNEKVKILKSIKPVTGTMIRTEVVRGQYSEGILDGMTVPSYREEENVHPQSFTETYAALRLFIDSWRWAGVPFFLRSGKRLPRRHTEIAIQFKRPPHVIFKDWPVSFADANVLTINIQPDEGISLLFNAKNPGFKAGMRPVRMHFSYGRTFGEALPEAYERLLLDVMTGDSTLFTRDDEIEHSWGFITGILDAMKNYAPKDIHFYRAGSPGPEQAQKLTASHNVRWRKI